MIGNPKSFALVEDAKDIYVLSEEETPGQDYHHLYKIELEKNELKIICSTCNCVADLPQKDKVLVAKGTKELREYDIGTNTFGEPIYTSEGNIMKIKTDAKGRYAFLKIKSSIVKVNLDSKVSELVLDVKANLIYDY